MKPTIPDNVILSDYSYNLPNERIAQHPLEQRDHSKLQVYNKGQITHAHFYELDHYLPENAFLFFNNTKVINARIFFTTQTGARVEVFVLEPIDPYPVNLALQATGTCTWECMIGNKRRWKDNEVLELPIEELGLTLRASILDREHNQVQFRWEGTDKHFSEIVEAIGKIPLPPYIKRIAEQSDSHKYQTIYSETKGAVAAPTAGLHFTPRVMEQLEKKGIQKDFFTLHVGAGTFLPIKEENVKDHDMHSEELIIDAKNLENILNNQGHIVAVGTTSMRVLETLYWLGMKIQSGTTPLSADPEYSFELLKEEPYQYATSDHLSLEASIQAILDYMKAKGLPIIVGKTQLFIVPGYAFKVCNGLITNYHMPQSTLILLVAAFIGEDWRRVYQEALDNGYRFLSYGDSSVLMP